MELSHLYFEQLNEEATQYQSDFERKTTEQKSTSSAEVYQCSDCFTLYEPAYGDEKAGIEEGVLFEDLPSDYVCPTCEEEKQQFQKLEVLLVTV